MGGYYFFGSVGNSVGVRYFIDHDTGGFVHLSVNSKATGNIVRQEIINLSTTLFGNNIKITYIQSSGKPTTIEIPLDLPITKSEVKEEYNRICRQLNESRGGKPKKSLKKKPKKLSKKKSTKKSTSKSTPKKHKGPRGGVYIIRKGRKIYQ